MRVQRERAKHERVEPATVTQPQHRELQAVVDREQERGKQRDAHRKQPAVQRARAQHEREQHDQRVRVIAAVVATEQPVIEVPSRARERS
jgi:hypothetical protein